MHDHNSQNWLVNFKKYMFYYGRYSIWTGELESQSCHCNSGTKVIFVHFYTVEILLQK